MTLPVVVSVLEVPGRPWPQQRVTVIHPETGKFLYQDQWTADLAYQAACRACGVPFEGSLTEALASWLGLSVPAGEWGEDSLLLLPDGWTLAEVCDRFGWLVAQDGAFQVLLTKDGREFFIGEGVLSGEACQWVASPEDQQLLLVWQQGQWHLACETVFWLWSHEPGARALRLVWVQEREQVLAGMNAFLVRQGLEFRVVSHLGVPSVQLYDLRELCSPLEGQYLSGNQVHVDTGHAFQFDPSTKKFRVLDDMEF